MGLLLSITAVRAPKTLTYELWDEGNDLYRNRAYANGEMWFDYTTTASTPVEAERDAHEAYTELFNTFLLRKAKR